MGGWEVVVVCAVAGGDGMAGEVPRKISTFQGGWNSQAQNSDFRLLLGSLEAWGKGSRGCGRHRPLSEPTSHSHDSRRVGANTNANDDGQQAGTRTGIIPK